MAVGPAQPEGRSHPIQESVTLRGLFASDVHGTRLIIVTPDSIIREAGVISLGFNDRREIQGITFRRNIQDYVFDHNGDRRTPGTFKGGFLSPKQEIELLRRAFKEETTPEELIAKFITEGLDKPHREAAEAILRDSPFP